MRKILLTILFLSLFSTAHADYTSNLQGWWKFDEGTGSTVADSSGNGYTGTFNYSGTQPVWVSYLNCVQNFDPATSCLDFEQDGGSTSFIDVGDQPNLAITGPVTVSAWLSWSSSQSCRGVAGRWDPGTTYILYIDCTNPDQVAFTVNDGATSYNVLSSIPLAEGVFHMFTGVYDGANVILYVDGGETEVVVGDAFSGTLNSAAAPVRIDNFGDSGGFNYLKNMDDVRIYDRGLTQQDVDDLYNATINPPVTFSSIISSIFINSRVYLNGLMINK